MAQPYHKQQQQQPYQQAQYGPNSQQQHQQQQQQQQPHQQQFYIPQNQPSYPQPPQATGSRQYEQSSPSSPYGPPGQQYGAPRPAQGQAFYQGQMDPLLGVAGTVLQQQGTTYLQKGQAFMQSKMGFLSGGLLHYHFSVTGHYVRNKLLMLLAPYLRHWNYTRSPEQIAGGHKYLPPRQDVNAPDLYIPFMAMWTYVIVTGATLLAHKQFKPTSLYSTVSGASFAWLVHWIILKAVLYMLAIPSAVPFLELAAYAGYPFVPTCLAMIAGVPYGHVGLWPYRVMWLYGSLAMGIFMVRTMKRIIFHETRHYNMDSSRHNYLLLALGVYQFFHIGWLSWVQQ